MVDSWSWLRSSLVNRRLCPCRSCHTYPGAVRQLRQRQQNMIHRRHARGVRHDVQAGEKKGGARIHAVLIFSWIAPALRERREAAAVHGIILALVPRPRFVGRWVSAVVT